MKVHGPLDLYGSDVYHDGQKQRNVTSVLNDSERDLLSNVYNGRLVVTLHDHKINIYKTNKWEKYNPLLTKIKPIYTHVETVDFNHAFQIEKFKDNTVHIFNNPTSAVIIIPTISTELKDLQILKRNGSLQINFPSGTISSFIEDRVGQYVITINRMNDQWFIYSN